MKHRFTFKACMAFALIVAALAVTGSTQAEDHHGLKFCGLGNLCCPKCNHCCTLDAEKVDVDKTCFEIECETVCVPRVVFPWQTGHWCFPWSKKKSHRECDACDGRGCDHCYPLVHNGARVRTVKVLKTKKYTCPECEYTWTPSPTCCGPDCDGGCDSVQHDYTVKQKPGPVVVDRPAARISYDDRESSGLTPIFVD